MTTKPVTKYLRDYQPPPFAVKTVDLHFDLHEDYTMVTAQLSIQRAAGPQDLVLDGRGLELINLALNDKALPKTAYRLEQEQLIIIKPPKDFTLTCTTKIKPQDNTSLEGLYRSNGIFCSQCEAEGFRKITYFPDHPDVMSVYTTTIEADKERCPVLLSNGNLVGQGSAGNKRHFAKWHDPFPKPCYIFALVAGDLAMLKDNFITKSDRSVELRIYTEHHNAEKCDHAMQSLKKAMAWDEQRFNLEYDLDLYMIVAVDDFNAGAMENKGLNIFNSKYVLARPESATDQDYEAIESVVGHEYFHNWTGNRITCRDWFQLSLKEGLTVFRDQEFSSDVASRSIKRIHDVSTLRNHQFPEDAGPMAHPVRPASYIEINNFYTLTVYEKGAEVIRMLHTILGEEDFQRGMRIYLTRHDGQAATTDDFVQAMEDASCESGQAQAGALKQFKRWYDQPGTPLIKVASSYDDKARTYSLNVCQEVPNVAGPESRMLHIPVKIGLLDTDGREIPLHLQGVCDSSDSNNSLVLQIKDSKQEFTFTDVPCRPVPSLLRGFSAPVRLEYNYSDEELAFLLLHDQDSFNRWEAAQRLLINKMMAMIADFQTGRELSLDAGLPDIFRAVLSPTFHDDPAFRAQIMTLPSEDYIAEQMAEIDVDAIHAVREFLRLEIGTRLADILYQTYENNTCPQPYTYSPELAGRRRLRNLCLSYMMADNTHEATKICLAQFDKSDNMTDELSALTALVHTGHPERRAALDRFFKKWQDVTLVVDKWFALQATAPLPDTLERVRELMGHPLFNIKNPNKVRALIGSFAAGNPICFHDKSGAGYALLTEVVLELNKLNPAIAARLLGRLSRWRKYDPARQKLMRSCLKKIIGQEGLAKGVYEVATRSLGES